MPGIADQYRIIAGAAGWRLVPERGQVWLTGRDRLAFLHALVTNDVLSLQPGQGAYAAWLTPQGRMITDMRVYARTDAVALAVPAVGAAALAAAFDRLVFSEDVAISDVSSNMADISVIGGTAHDVLSRAFGLDAATVSALPSWSQIDIPGGFIARSDDARLPSYELCVASGDAARIAERLGAEGATPLSDDLATSMRVDAGRPLFGADMDTDSIPLEAGLLDRAISTTKGCYVGQEVIIRVLHRGGGRVARRLVRIEFPAATSSDVHAGTTLTAAGADVGRITSAAPPLDGAGIVALGYVRREVADESRDVQAVGAPAVTGRITGLAG